VCIGIPVQVQSCDALQAWCSGRGERHRIDLQLVGEQDVGTWLLAFQGSAVRVLTPEEAAQTNAALDALAAALTGETDFDAYFPDLVDRKPHPPTIRSELCHDRRQR